MSTVTDWAITNGLTDINWLDGTSIYYAYLATSGYVWDSSQVTLQDAIDNGFLDAGLLGGRIVAADRTNSGTTALAANVVGITSTLTDGNQILQAGIATQLLIVYAEGAPTSEMIAAQIDLDSPVSISLTDTIGIVWDEGRVFDVATPEAFAPTITGGSGGFTPPNPNGVLQIWSKDLADLLADNAPYVTETLEIDDPISDVGLLKVQIGLDEDAAEFLVNDNNIKVVIAGEDAFTARIEAPYDIQHVTLDGQAMQLVTLSCRGYVAELEDTPILPFGGVDAKPQALTRPMTWCSPEADIADLDDAVVLYDALSVPYDDPVTHFDPPWFSPWLPPKGYPDPTTKHIWASTPDPVTGHPVQTRRFVKDIEITEAGLYQFWAFADDYFELYGNGILLGQGNNEPSDSFIIPWTGCWNLTEQTLRVGLLGKNFQRPTTAAVGTFGGPNIGRVGFALYGPLPDGVNTLLTADLLVAHTDDTWKTSDTDDPLPAPTWGKIAETFLTEGQSEDMADGYTLTCTPTEDSNGNPWVPQGDQSFGIADDTTILSVLRTGSTSGCIDWHADPSTKTIDITNFGEMGAPVAATFIEDDGTLIDLKETTNGPPRNSLLTRAKTGLKVVEDATSITAIGRKRGSLPLADLDMDAAVAQANRELLVRASPASSFTAAIEVDAGSSTAPYGTGGWHVGDSPTFRTDVMRAMRISTTFDVGGNPTFVPELQTRLQGAAERQQIALSKAGASLGGTSRAATPLEGMDGGVVAGFVQTADTITFTQIQLTSDPDYADVFDVSNRRKWAQLVRVHRIDIEQFVPPQAADTVWQIMRTRPGVGDEVVATMTEPVGVYHAIELPEYLHFTEFDSIWAQAISYDTPTGDPHDDARWLTINVYAIQAHPATVQPPAVDVPW